MVRRSKRTPPPEILDDAIASASSILLREDSPAGLARAERTIGVTWPSLTATDRGYVLGYALAALRERTRLLEAMPVLEMPSRELPQ